MSLVKVGFASPPLQYPLYEDIKNDWQDMGIADYLHTPPRIYGIEIDGVDNFFYSPTLDKLVMNATYNFFANIALAHGTVILNADSGRIEGEVLNDRFDLGRPYRPSNANRGSGNKIFGRWELDGPFSSTVIEVDAYGISWFDGGWSTNPYAWNPPGTAYYQCLVNLENNGGMMVGIGDGGVEIWRNINTTPVKYTTLFTPGGLFSTIGDGGGDLCWESNESMWIITSNGQLMRLSYAMDEPRYEMLTILDAKVEGESYRITYDGKRSRLVLLRRRPPATDGACQDVIEFYKPIYCIKNLTEPYPVSIPRAGKITKYVTHLIGTMGEGIASYVVNAESSEGVLLGSMASTEVNGRATFQVLESEEAPSSTISVLTTISDGRLAP